MPDEKAKNQSQEYTFDYDWSTVMKGFWNKYPDKKLDFVKWNKVIGFDVTEDGNIKFKRIIFIKKLYFIWAYGLETLEFDFKTKILDAKTRVLKKSMWVPYSADEFIQYKQFLNNNKITTTYRKILDYKSGAVSTFLSKVNKSYIKGCMIVAHKCMLIKQLEEKFKNEPTYDLMERLKDFSE